MPTSDLMTPLADARAAALDGRFDVAAELAERILASSPTCLAALRILAWAQLELGDDRAPDRRIDRAAQAHDGHGGRLDDRRPPVERGRQVGPPAPVRSARPGERGDHHDILDLPRPIEGVAECREVEAFSGQRLG